MFALPISRPYAILLYALLAIWAALLILGFAFGWLDEQRINRIPRTNKMFSSIILVICALIWWRAGVTGTQLAGYYDPDVETMYLAGDLAPAEQNATLAHELVRRSAGTLQNLQVVESEVGAPIAVAKCLSQRAFAGLARTRDDNDR